jgi:hypothetical protein
MNEVSEVTYHRHKNHLTHLIFRREWGNVTCTCKRWKYERQIYRLLKVLSENLGVKSESLTWLVCRNKSFARTWSWHILGWRHINFIKPKTYSALLLHKACDSSHLWREFMRVTKHFLQNYCRNYGVYMTHFFTILWWIKCVCLPWHLNIMICTARILRQQKQTFEQIYNKF